MSLFSWTQATLLICINRRQTMAGRKASLAPTPLVDQVYLARTQREATTKENPPNNFQEEILGYEDHLTICPLEDRDRAFEVCVSRHFQHHNTCARRMVKVTIEMKRRWQTKKKRNRPRSRLCCGFDRFKVDIGWDVLYIWWSHSCTNFMGMQETEDRVSQQHRS